MTSTHGHTTSRVNRHRALVAWIAGLACIVGLVAAAQAFKGVERERPDRAELQAALDRVVAAGAPGASVLVRDGDETMRLTSGLGNLAPKRQMRATDQTRIGGLTKTYTATVVLQLAGEGKLDLDDTVERWLPGAISNGGTISVRQLLNHTSGIYSYDKEESVLAPYRAGDFTRLFDPRAGIRIARDHGPLFAPGTRLSYSNTNYLLLARIVEAATGGTIGAQLHGRIFAPLGLRHTSYPTSSRVPRSFTHGYLAGKEPVDVTALSPTLLGPAGGMLSSAGDVARFYRELLGGSLLAGDLRNEMRSIDSAARGGIPDAGIRGGGWGLGLLRETFPCGTAWGHDSETPGYMAAAWNDDHADRQVVVIVNSNGGPDEPMSRAMRALLTTAYCGR